MNWAVDRSRSRLGSEDTRYKERFFGVLEQAYTHGKLAGEVDLEAEAPERMRFRLMIQKEGRKSEREKSLS